MKKLLSSIALFSLLTAVAVVAQQAATNPPGRTFSATADTNAPIKITSAEVRDHIGARVIVTGKVAEVNKAASLVRLNIDKPFPDQTFTAVIFNRYTNQFFDLESLKGKQVELNGRIALYRGHPELQLQSTNQLKVLEAPAAQEKK
jgi:DNA/RNA endonuclease YhcR with UshA esterase domain